jgi:hypothetical protein
MSNPGKFDEFIKNKFSDSSPEVPSGVWENIVAAREERKPKAFWWNAAQVRNIAAGLAILLSCGGITWMLTHRYHTIDTNALATNTAVSKNNTGAINSITGIKNTNTASIIPGQSSSSIDKNNTAVNNISSGTSNAIPTNTTVAIVTTGTNKKILVFNKRAGFAKSHHVRASQEELSVADDQTIASSPDINNIPAVTPSTTSAIAIVTPFNNKVPNLTAVLNADDVLKKSSMRGISLPECPTVEKAPSRKRDYIQVYAGPDYGIRTMSDDADPAYLKSRDSSSRFTSAYSVGVNYTKVFANGLSLREGLNYSQINEWFTAAKNNSFTVYQIDQSGDTLGKTVTYKVTHNHYSTVDIPITLGYEFRIGNSGRFVANVNAGAVINIFSWQNGDVLDTADNTIHITTNRVPYTAYSFKTAMGLGFVANLSVYYKLSDQIAVFAEPYARYNIQPMTQDVASFTEKYTTIGLHLGLRFDMN